MKREAAPGAGIPLFMQRASLSTWSIQQNICRQPLEEEEEEETIPTKIDVSPIQRQNIEEEEEEPIQTKLRIGQPDDEYEQEANRVADTIMAMPEPRVRRRCGECEEKEGGWPDFRVFEGGVVAEGRTGTLITGGVVFIPRKYTFTDEEIVVSTRWNIEERRRLFHRVRSVFL